MHLRRSRFTSIFVLPHDRVLPHFAQSPVEGNPMRSHAISRKGPTPSIQSALLAATWASLATQRVLDRLRMNSGRDGRSRAFRGHPSKELKRNRLAFSFVKIREFSQRIVKQNRVQPLPFTKIYPRF